MFMLSDTRKRTRYIDAAISQTRDVLENNPQVREALGSVIVNNRLQDLDRMFVPNFRNGRVDIPKQHRNGNGIPILAVNVGEAVLGGNGLGFTPTQRQRAYEQVKGWKLKNGSNETLRAMVDDIDTCTANKVGAQLFTPGKGTLGFATGAVSGHIFTREHFTNLGKSTDRSAFGRPIVGLVMHEEGVAKESQPVTMLHELEHARQRIMQPIRPDLGTGKFSDHNLRMELEAYHIGAVTGSALYRSDDERYYHNPAVLNDVPIDDIRMDNAPSKDAFAPQGVIRQALLEVGLDF